MEAMPVASLPVEPPDTPSMAPEPGSPNEVATPVAQAQPPAVPDEHEAAMSDMNMDLAKPTTPDAPKETASPAHLLSAHNPRKGHIVVIAIAVVLFALLAGIAVLVYAKTKNGAKEIKDDRISVITNTKEMEGLVPATDADLAASDAQIDKSIDDTKDATSLSDDELTDNTLGLQ